ncbi:FKBP-type peptidyl-prolyl cis-trans isomerase [Amphritea sp. 2_MG-2023]|jgi:FKBP-type peptidyl-prolyl cis-trans isomerase|uniref:FKBP-type peptidyl-prolyl cis-trans isomerase n=1 Tax=Amphritea TaxID=515417 RepID=UPI002090F32F|nr:MULTISPECIES: FKBP-type peptidyl-prolyl cis-trans isomerase [Amphritea]MDO6418053.1 FKBP-type peptidyl-prolyl cis-trans isomerase [Amphritea sp. 2_MG-2023]MDX2423795.1 FKBP-type peptidyl-prolyl cis-trans isomerase [Amphritea sp.]
MRVVSVVFLSLLVTLISGCGKSEEEKQFRQQLLDKALNDDTKKAGNRFLADNAQREGVVVTDSGLQYEILQPAQGPTPRVLDRVRVRYTGWTVDGEEFEGSALKAEQPVFTIKDVIKGWRLALLKMSPGARWKIYLPSELAYGARSPGGMVPANSALIFEIELLEILPEEKADK